MSKKPTTADAEVILKLYDLRREAEMRKARDWVVQEFWPSSFEDYAKIGKTPHAKENAWLRQVCGYWEMASSLVIHGAVHADLFLEPSFSSEMFLLFAKVRPFLKDLRQQSSPSFFLNVEALATSSKKSREFLKRMEGNLGARREMLSKAK
jgi:hypothetical protein